jgi:hypothetical protein
MSKLTIAYTILAAVIIGLYTWSTATGQEYFHPGKEKTTAEEKRSGYRGGYFIFIGHSRGK